MVQHAGFACRWRSRQQQLLDCYDVYAESIYSKYRDHKFIEASVYSEVIKPLKRNPKQIAKYLYPPYLTWIFLKIFGSILGRKVHTCKLKITKTLKTIQQLAAMFTNAQAAHVKAQQTTRQSKPKDNNSSPVKKIVQPIKILRRQFFTRLVKTSTVMTNIQLLFHRRNVLRTLSLYNKHVFYSTTVYTVHL